MSDPDAVAAALARLVNGAELPPPRAGDREPPPTRVVADAEAALDRLPTAARFVADGGEQRLRRAVEADDTDTRLADRGRAVLAALDRLRVAADPSDPSDPSEKRPADDDHFHLGRTTLLKGDGVAPDR